MSKWLVGAAVVGLALSAAAVRAEDKADKKEAGPVLGHTMKGIDGKDVELSKYKGKVLLIVNVASYCGATPQYKDLQELHDKYAEEGLAVVGVPCNQFGEQEPGSDKEIVEFCEAKYKVTFDLLSKVDVNGDKQCDLYKYLTSKEAVPSDAGNVKWNFEKFLVGRDGKVAGRFRTGVKPSSDKVVAAIEAELKKK